MKITSLLAALLAVVALSACEKTTVNPSPTVITPTVEVPVAVPGPAVAVPVPGPAGAPGTPGADGAKGADGKPGDTVIVVPEKTN
ncbi:MAG: collagen-like protein [Pseudomonadota bacterium]